MKFRSLVSLLLAFATSLIVSGCGGGASHDPNVGGELTILPSAGSFYAGVKSTITISGGLAPYVLTSSDPGILPVPNVLEGHFLDVVPANPGVVDPGLTAGEVPRRTVTITARDSKGFTVTSKIAVLQNFLTGYTIVFTQSTCPAVATPCAGGETVVQLAAVTNGALFGDKLFKFEMVRSECRFVDSTAGNTLVTSVQVRTDHNGVATAVMRCPAGIASQIGLIRVTDVASGVTADFAFAITQASATQSLTAIPTTLTFTGKDSTVCGTGQGDFLVFDGLAPYAATSTDQNISVTPTSATNPGRFTVTASNPQICVASATIIVTDSRSGRTTVTVKTEKGSGSPPTPPAMSVSPTDITLACGTSGSVTVVGGSGSYFTASSHPRITAVVSGNTVTITRLTGDGVVVYPVTGDVSITDGTTIKDVTVHVPANCP